MILIRPYFLLLLLVPVIIYFLSRREKSQSIWYKVIQPQFLPYLLVGGHQKIRHTMNWFLVGLWSLLSIALSGPAFEKVARPSVDIVPASVLLVDLNTMNAEKLAQLKIKLTDLLSHLQGNQVGLVLYDSKGYIVSPLTQDVDILREMITAFSPAVLPTGENKVEVGFATAIELLQNAGQKQGRILYLTGGAENVAQASALVKSTPYKVGVLAFGAPGVGSPILGKNGAFLRERNGNLKMAFINEGDLSTLGTYKTATLDDSDFLSLLDSTKLPQIDYISPTQSQSFFTADVYKDLGVYLLVILMPFIALLFRKGAFFILILGCCPMANANPFMRQDQLDYQVVQEGILSYKSQDYQQANAAFASVNTIDALYNQANATAQLGQYQQAIEMYKSVLEQNPHHAPAQFNKEYLEKQLQQQQENQDNQESQENSENKEKQKNSKKQESQENSENQENQESSEQQSSESDSQQESQSPEQSSSESQQESQSQESQSQELENQESQKQEAKDESQDAKPESPEADEQEPSDTSDQHSESQSSSSPPQSRPIDNIDQESQEILNRLQKDPTRLLRERLYQQYHGGR